MPNQSDRLAWLNFERYVFEYPVLIFIGKPNILEFDAALRASGLRCVSGRRDGDRKIERFENSMRRDYRRLQHVVLVRDVANRLKEKTRILDESHQRAEREHRVAGRVLHH